MTSRLNLKLASFDGGGVRGLSQLEIINNIIHRLNWNGQSNGSKLLLPYEHFNLIGGSGTGGLIAIMLAKLRMTIEEASEEFCTIAEEVYKQIDITPKDRTRRLKQCMENLMNKRRLSVDMKLLDEAQTGGCACFVVATPRNNAATKMYLRSYPVNSHPASTITVIEAVLATCATQPDFAPVTFGLNYKRKEYIGAGIGANNPVNEVIIEANSLYGGNSTVASLLSIGTGHPGVINILSDGGDVDLYKAMREMMNDCTQKAREIKQRIGRSGIYYRFSVEQGMQSDHPSQAVDLGWIVTQTESYIEENIQQLDAFARNNSSPINLVTLGQLKSGDMQSILPANVDVMDADDAGGSGNEAGILAKLKPSEVECSPAVGECMEGTRQDILSIVLDWASDFEAPNIFWIKGHPGVGKSAISVSLTESFRELKRLGSSFFFQRERANSLTPNALWRVVAYDLARKYPTIRKRLIATLQANDALIMTLNTEKLFRELIHDPLTTSDGISTQNAPIIIIDAPDECGGLDGQRSEHRANLRRTLKSWSNLPRLFKLVVTSRGEADFEQLFTKIDHVPLEIYTGAAARPHSLADIKRFLEDQCHEIVNRYQSGLPVDWPGSPVIQELTFKSGGLFIWAKIITGFLNQGEPQEQLSRILAGTGAGGMATLYTWILKAAFPHPSAKVINAFHSLVGTIIIAKHPLPASSLMDLCSIDESTMRYIFNGLQSVMTSGDIPRFKHQSIVDFLIDPKHCPPVFLIDRDHRSQKITLDCLLVMKKYLKFNICDIESSYYRNSNIGDLASKVKERILPHITYSCCFWTNHLTECQFNLEIYESICDFMNNRFLFWIEVLSLTKHVSLATNMMQLLISWLQASGRDDTMAQDMKKFISTFGSVISQSVPHIYLSALPLSPQRSIVLKEYGRRYPQTIKIRSGGQYDWPAIQNILIGHTDYVNSVGFSPDGRRIASGSDDMKIRIWDAETGEAIAGPFEGHTSAVTSVQFSPDGRRVISGSNDKTIRIWDAETGEVVAGPFGHTGSVNSVAFSPDGKHVVSGSWDMAIRLWDAGTGKVVAGPFKGHTSYVSSVGFSPDGKRIISGSNDKTIRLWDAETGKVVRGPFEGHTGSVDSVAFSPDGKHVVSGSWDRTIRLWDTDTGEVVAGPFDGHTHIVSFVGFSPDGNRIVSGSWDSTIRVWDAKTGKLFAGPFGGHANAVTSVQFSPDGNRIVSSSWDNTIRVWNAEACDIVAGPFEGHTGQVKSVALSPDGKRVVSGSFDQTIRVWDAETGEVVAGPFEGHVDRVNSVQFSPDGNFIASGSDDSTIRVWDTKAGNVVIGPFEGHTHFVTSVQFSPDGRCLVSGSFDQTIRVWDVNTGEVVAGPFRGHTSQVNSVAFSPNGRRVVSGSIDHTVRVWDAKTGEVVAGPFEGHTDRVNSVQFSPDGNCIASGSDDSTILVWDAKTGEVFAGPFKGHTSWVTSVAFSPDGRRIVSGSYDSTIRVWDTKTGEIVAGPFVGHTYYVDSVAFLPDGNHIVSCSFDKTIRVWDLTDYTSDLPLFTDSSKMVDGWILGPNSELLFWVPPDLRTGLYWPRNTAFIGRFIKTQLDLKCVSYGESWYRCKDPLPECNRLNSESTRQVRSTTRIIVNSSFVRYQNTIRDFIIGFLVFLILGGMIFFITQ